MKNSILLIIIITSCSFILNAQIVTDRPDVTESSSVVPKNSFQIESGMIIQRSDEFESSPINVMAPSTLFRFGISKYFELRFFSQYQNNLTFINGEFPSISSGFNDIELGTKVQLYQKEGARTEIAFITHLLIPSGTDSFTNSEYVSINKVAVSHGITDYLGVGYNVGYTYDFSGTSMLTYSLSIGYSINDKFGVYIEPYGDITEFDEHFVNLDGGLTYKLRDNFQADFAFGTGLNSILNYYGVGFSWNIARDSEE